MFQNRRSGYTLITRHSQILNHFNEENDIDSVESRLLNNNEDKSTISSVASEDDPITIQQNAQTNTMSPVVYTIYGYQHSIFRKYLFHILSILFFGIPYLIFRWFSFGTQLKYRKCNLGECDVVLVTNNRGLSSIVSVHVLCSNLDSNIISYNDVLKQINNDHSSVNQIRIFTFEHVRYVFNYRVDQFVRMQNLDEFSTTNQLIHSNQIGLTTDQRSALLQLYGSNTIEIAVKSYWDLFRSEILNPFYLFQIFSITLWCCDEYYYYAGCVFLLSAISIFASLHETRAQSITLHNVIESLRSGNINVVQPKEDDTDDDIQIKKCSPDILVPGDIIEMPIDGGIMACDAILLSGSCIVNESMLTGESVPVTKTPPMPNDQSFEWLAQKRHILYAGTTILQTRYYGKEKVLAKVVRTGFNTSKGELIKSILFPRPIEFRFYEDSIKFIGMLFIVASLGIVYTVRLYSGRGADFATIILRALDIVTIVVPPALPLAMTAGTVYSQGRLKKKNIFCISPQRINVCGKLKLICFDKTGTLTDDGLTMDGCIECRNGKFIMIETQPPNTFDEKSLVVQNMATCHSLTTIHGTLNGDPLDIEMFRSIDWENIEPGDEHTRFDALAPTVVRPKLKNRKSPSTSPTSEGEIVEVPYSIGIIKQHQFSSEAQCMSVVVRILGDNHMKVFTKGAPEKILSLCKSQSIPNDFFQVLHRYTSRGYRVIAMAHKKLSSKIKWVDVERMKRTEIETELVFDGFLVLLNCLKPETTHIIQDLHAAKLRTVMITGDNIMTALSVAKDCQMIGSNEDIYVVKCETNGSDRPKLVIELSRESGMVNGDTVNDDDRTTPNMTFVNLPSERFHFALDGTTWNVIQTFYPQFIPKIVARGTIFARFRPEQKSQIVLCLQQYDYIVAMCGDGANDCGALKAAHIGISLSQAEASVAAPFTSKDQNISCVKHLALEGRCALVTSFGLFKYMTMYSLIQFCTILILYTHFSILGNFQFLYIDLIITASLAFTMGRQGPSGKLVAKRPSSSLLSLANMIPLILQVFLCAFVQVAGIVYLNQQNWFQPLFSQNITLPKQSNVTDFIEETLCWENTVLFSISCYQYLILGVVYSKGLPYRQPIYKNGLLIVFVGLITAFTSLLVLHPSSFLSDTFEIEAFSSDQIEINAFRWKLLLLPLIHLTLSYGIELLIVDRRWYKQCLHFIMRKKIPKNKFKKIELDLSLKNNQDWNNFFNDSENVTT